MDLTNPTIFPNSKTIKSTRLARNPRFRQRKATTTSTTEHYAKPKPDIRTSKHMEDRHKPNSPLPMNANIRTMSDTADGAREFADSDKHRHRRKKEREGGSSKDPNRHTGPGRAQVGRRVAERDDGGEEAL